MQLLRNSKSRGWTSGGNRLPRVRMRRRSGEYGYSLVEVIIAFFLLGTLSVALFGAFMSGLSAVQSARENLRATQIMMQKVEAIRLFTWQQSTNKLLATPTFTDWYDPTGTNTHEAGALYRGFVTVTSAPPSVSPALRPNLRLVRVTLTWTNSIGRRTGRVQTRQLETLISRYGLQHYVF